MVDQMLTERYRPQTLNDIIGHDRIVTRMNEWVDDRTIPHLMFSGRQGVGKTAICVAFAREVYGDEWRKNFLDINASDARGIDVIRNKVKNFAQRSTSVDTDVSYKIIFMDEADHLTNDAQAAFRRIMEDYSNTTRFFLSCNYPNKIIDAIGSRCVVLPVQPLSDSEVRTLVERVVSKEGIDAEDNALWKIVRIADGDARKALNTLQASTIDGTVDDESVSPLMTVLPGDEVEEILDNSVRGEFKTAMNQLEERVFKRGVSPTRFCEEMTNVIISKNYGEDVKFLMVSKVGAAERNINIGGTPYVQLHSLLGQLAMARHQELRQYNQ